MGWKRDTQQLAIDAAVMYYDNALTKGKYPGEYNLYKGMPREEAIKELAKKYIGRLREVIPEQGYTEELAKQVAKLDVGAVEKYMFEFGEEPFGASRKSDFAQVMDKWYSWSPKEMEAQMYHFGYNPAKAGDKQKFLAELSEYQKNTDRAKIVQEEIGDAGLGTRLALAAYPSMTEEATRQSLTGDFDDSRMNRATVADVLANGTIAIAPSARALSGAFAQGAVAAGAETARQLIKPTESNVRDAVGDVLLAATTAGTVPGVGTYIGGTISKGASTGARRFGKEFARGLRGADDPLMQERNALKQALIDARKQSVSTADKPYTTGNTWYASEASPQDLANARKWSDAEAKLNALGFNTESKYNALADNLKATEANLKAAKQAEREAILAKPKSRKKEAQLDYQENVRMHDQLREEAQTAYENALKDIEAYDNSVTITKYGDELPVEDVIGQNPATVNAGPVVAYRAPKDNGIEAALNAYDRPMVFGGGLSRAPGMDESTLASFTNMENRYKAAFPEAYQQALWYGEKNTPNTRALKLTRGAGRVIGGVGGRIEPVTGSLATLLTGGDVGQKVTRFKESKWFKNLPKEKKNAIEKALKGED